MIKHIQDKINNLKHGIAAIDYTKEIDKVGTNEYFEKRRHDLIVQIEVLNEVIISYGVQKRNIN